MYALNQLSESLQEQIEELEHQKSQIDELEDDYTDLIISMSSDIIDMIADRVSEEAQSFSDKVSDIMSGRCSTDDICTTDLEEDMMEAIKERI